MGVATAAGAKLYIGTTATDGSTDSYTEVGEVVNIPEFGRSYNEIKYNPLNTRGTQKFKGSYDDGSVSVELGKDAADAGQQALIAALDTDFDYNFKVESNDKLPAASATVTISASTDEVTDTGHGLPANTPVKFATTGALPSGLVAGTTYYVKTVVDADTYTLSATPGGAALNFPTSPAQSGTHTRTTVPTNTYQLLKAKVMSYTTKIGTLDGIIGSTAMLGIKSGSLVEHPHLP